MTAALREDKPDKRAQKIDELRDEIDKWLDDDQLDPTIADRANRFRDDLAEPSR